MENKSTKPENRQLKNAAFTPTFGQNRGLMRDFGTPTFNLRRLYISYLLNVVLHKLGLARWIYIPPFEDKAFVWAKAHWFPLAISGLMFMLLIKNQFSFSVSTRKDSVENIQQASLGNLFQQPPGSQDRSSEAWKKIPASEVSSYIERFRKTAEGEEKKYGVPVSVTLGIAVLNSYSGLADWAINGHNHFAINSATNIMTEGLDGEMKYGDIRLAKFKNAWTCFRANSLLLNTERYATVRALAGKDYKLWAKGLQAAGYSQDKDFETQLIQVIEKYLD